MNSYEFTHMMIHENWSLSMIIIIRQSLSAIINPY